MATKTRLEIRRLTPVVGAVIGGVDLARPLEPEAIAEIRRTVLTQGVAFFRGQTLTDEQYLAFMAQFGSLGMEPFTLPELQGEPTVTNMTSVDKSAPDPFWHVDSTHGAEPVAFLALRAVELPASGGDTCWGSLYAAYEALSGPVRDWIDGLYAEHTGYKSLSRLSPEHRKYLQQDLRNVHPVVRVHPETGRKALFVNELWTEKIVGVSQHESDHILRMLWDHSARPEFTMRWQWQVNDLAFFDNRAFQHYAVRDYEGTRVLP
jgi:taurine dioxygenase